MFTQWKQGDPFALWQLVACACTLPLFFAFQRKKRVSSGLGSNVSTCEGPPSMYKKMTFRALASEGGWRGASAFRALLSAGDANVPSASSAAKATDPKPLAAVWSHSRRVPNPGRNR